MFFNCLNTYLFFLKLVRNKIKRDRSDTNWLVAHLLVIIFISNMMQLVCSMRNAWSHIFCVFRWSTKKITKISIKNQNRERFSALSSNRYDLFNKQQWVTCWKKTICERLRIDIDRTKKKKKDEYVEYFHGTCEFKSSTTNFVILKALTIINSVILANVFVVMNSALPEESNHWQSWKVQVLSWKSLDI